MIASSSLLGESRFALLREIVARGTDNAARGLSEMVGRSIHVQTPDVSLLPIGRVPTLLHVPDATVVGVYLAVSGDVQGHIVLLFSPSEARGLVDMLMDQPSGTTMTLGAMERSALGEVGNLVGSFFLTALGDATDLCIHPSPPAVIVDMGAAILDIPLVSLAATADEALVVNTHFADDQRKIEAIFLVMPDMPSLQAILGVLGSGV